MANQLIIGADNLITIDKLIVPNSNPPQYVNNASITWTLKDGNGNLVSGGSGSYTYVIGSNGEYQTVIPAAVSTILLAGSAYTLASNVTATGFVSLFTDTYYAETPQSAQFSYAVRSDLENIYGTKNVARWADIENTGVATTIDARINWALVLSYDFVNNKLFGGPYNVPLQGNYPMIVTTQAQLACVYLYESRGLTNVDEQGNPIHQLEQGKKWAENILLQIRGGTIRLANAIAVDIAGTIIPKAIRSSYSRPAFGYGYGWPMDNFLW